MIWTLGRKLGLVFSFLILFFSLTLGISAYFVATNYMRQEIQVANQMTVKNVQDYYLQNQLKDLSKTVKYWSANPGLIDDSHNSTLGMTSLKVLLSEWKSYLALNNSASMVYFASSDSDDLLAVPKNSVFVDGFDPHEREWYKGAIGDPDQVFWSRPYTDAEESQNTIVTVSKAVKRGNKIIGVIGVDLRLRSWSALLEGVYANQAGYLVLMGPLGEVYSHPNSDMLGKQVTGQRWADVARNQKEGKGFFTENGRNYVYSFVTLGETGWRLIGVQIVNFEALTDNLKWMTAYTIIMVALVMILGGFLAARYILKPLHKMLMTMQAVSSGNMEVRSAVASKDEIGVISYEFDLMLDRLSAMNKERDENLALVLEQNKEISEQRQEIHSLYEMTDSINQELEESLEKITANYLITVKSLANAIEANDAYTRGHCDRVSRLALLLGERAGLSETEMKNLEFACILHDIGKIGIPNHIVNKPGKLTAEEFDRIKQHPVIGSDILSGVSFLGPCREILLQHHERIDGLGYPFGLKADAILKESKILAIVDSFDAMTSNRPYRIAALSVEEAAEELRRGGGAQFDASLTDLFMTLVPRSEFKEIVEGQWIELSSLAG